MHSEENKKVLLIEDNPGDARLFQELMTEAGAEGFELVHVTCLTDAFNRLAAGRFDLVLVDLGMPDSQGLDTFMKLRETAVSLPVVVLTGLDDRDLALQAVQEGAQDYLVKGELGGSPILRALRYAMERHRLQAHLRDYTAELAASERRFRTIFDAATDGIFIADPETRQILDVNRAGCELLGYTAEELKKLSVAELGFGEAPYDDEAEQKWADLTVEEGPQVFEWLSRKRSGETVAVEVSMTVVSLGGTDRLMASVRDITERKRTEEEVRKLSRAVEQSPASVVITDLEGKIEYVNPKFSQVTGYTHQEVLGKNPRILKSGETSQEEYRELWETITRGGEWRGVFANRKKNGELFWESASISPIRDAAGRITHFLAVKEDITARKQAEEALWESERNLKGLVRNLPEGVCLLDGQYRLVMGNPPALEYLAALGSVSVGEAVSQLGGIPIAHLLVPRQDGLPHEVRAKDDRIFEVGGSPVSEGEGGEGWALVIRDVSEERETQERIQTQYRLASVGQMAAGIAHDFNNMLTVMIGFAQMLDMRPDLPRDAREDIGQIAAQGQRAAQLIRQVLDFSRKSVSEQHVMDLVPFLKEAGKMLDRILPETVAVRLLVETGRCPVMGNPGQLQQVFNNLVVNAKDALPEGGEIRVGLSRLTVGEGVRPPLPGMEPGEWAVWTVSDSGTGMPPEVMKHIFEPFFTTKPPGKGTGLGLAQAYGLVKQHNGEIDVESEEGTGTEFRIYLPLAEVEEAPKPVDRSRIRKGNGETVLVVEDDPAVLATVEGILQGLNYQVLSARNGREGLEVFRAERERIDLVLTDLVMPGMGGIELYFALKEEAPDVKVVVMTGYADEEAQPVLHRVEGMLVKPLSVEEMANVIRDALAAGRNQEGG